jgi:hypothetical protein
VRGLGGRSRCALLFWVVECGIRWGAGGKCFVLSLGEERVRERCFVYRIGLLACRWSQEVK